ncbi:MAG: flagellin [Candidatus Hydrogenedentota bacterium]
MAFHLRSNIVADFARRNLGLTIARQNLALERLTSGLRINRSADDPAGLAVSERLRTQVLGLHQAQRNSEDAISLVQIAEGGLQQIDEIIQRMRSLAIQAANATLTSADRTLVQVEINQLIDEIDRQASSTQFNTKKIFTQNQSLTFHVGANRTDTLTLQISSVTAAGLGVDTVDVTGSSNVNALKAISQLDTALDRINTQRANLGAFQNRLENVVNFIGISSENMASALAKVREADIAEEIVNFTREQILAQTGTALLAQANQTPATVLALLT